MKNGSMGDACIFFFQLKTSNENKKNLSLKTQMGCLKLTYQTETKLRLVRTGSSREGKCAQLWLSVDPLAEDYPSISPYVYVANNPIKYVDPNGEDIYLSFASPKARAAYKTTVNKALGGAYTVNISDKTGKVTLVATGRDFKTDGQRAFYDAYSEISTSKYDVHHDVNKDSWAPYGGSFDKGTLDIGDAQKFDEAGEGGATGAGLVIHETVEQFEKAKMGIGKEEDYTKEQFMGAHEKANEVQDMVQGNKVTKSEKQGLYKVFEESNGTHTLQKVQIQGNEGEKIKVTKSKID